MDCELEPPWPLPMECCALIVDWLGRDPASLAALMRVNQAMFALAAPRLYQDPFGLLDEQFLPFYPIGPDKRIWELRRERLYTTLFHGILVPVDGKSDPATMPRAAVSMDMTRAPNRYLEYYTHVDLTPMLGTKTSQFRRLFSPKKDNIGLPLIGVKNLLQYQCDRITSLSLPFRLLKTFRPYQRTPTFPNLELFTSLRSLRCLKITGTVMNEGNPRDDSNGLLWSGLRDGIALRREDLGEHCRLHTIELLLDNAFVGRGPSQVAAALHPGLQSFAVHAIADIPNLLSSFSEQSTCTLRRLSLMLNTTPLSILVPLFQRFHNLEELSICLSGAKAAVGLENYISQNPASMSSTTMVTAVTTTMGATPALSIKHLRVLICGKNLKRHHWLRDAIALCASTLEELTVLESPWSCFVGRWLGEPQGVGEEPETGDAWLTCDLPKLVRLIYLSNDISFPFTFPPFYKPLIDIDDNTIDAQRTDLSISHKNSDKPHIEDVMDPITKMLPVLASLYLIRAMPYDGDTHTRFPSVDLNMDPVLFTVSRLNALQHLTMDLSSNYGYSGTNPRDIVDHLPRGLKTFEIGTYNPSSLGKVGKVGKFQAELPKVARFKAGLHQAFFERCQEEVQTAMNGSATYTNNIWLPIPKVSVFTPSSIHSEQAEEIFWRHKDIRNYLHYYGA